MALKRDFKKTAKKRFGYDPEFANTLLHESVHLMLDGDSATAKVILRDLINATVGFERLAEEVRRPSKSLHRMLSNSGNPTMENLSAIFASIKNMLQVKIGIKIHSTALATGPRKNIGRNETPISNAGNRMPVSEGRL